MPTKKSWTILSLRKLYRKTLEAGGILWYNDTNIMISDRKVFTMLVFYPVIAVLHVLSCVSETLGRFLPFVNVAVHIAAFAVFALAGAELEDMLLLLLFSSAVGLAAGDFNRRSRANEKDDGKGETE